MRAFIQAVQEYTGARKVDVIGHSMGVTLARKAIQGGPGYDPYGGDHFDLGAPLTGRVDTFVGIAGSTGPIPGQDGQKVFSSYPHGHMGSRDLSVETQLAMITEHEVR
ncbi:hypothetical protein [Cystobacter ferrugineus]|uniref:Lipase n=1 Tax=Cystobacter ferrugineus TaxID=83449 RepID=A0A1L9BAE6_9BACT|nr:hypothetical protein [Cystobacter ferrugineus]OJH39211.1 hypothetical protein BON30_16900 [Cystobacter ferrugineus]